MKNCFRLLLVVTSVITAAWQAAAQSPNDNFANAWALSGIVATTNGNTGQATKESGEPNHAGNQGGRSVWFRWVAPTNGLTQIDTGGSAFNTLLAVYTGNAVSTLTQVAANDNAPGFGALSMVQFNAIAGTTYRIAVDGNRGFFGQAASGDYTLNLQVFASVNLTSITNNQIIYAGTPIPLNVVGFVPNMPITRVDFYRAGALIGSDPSEPFSMTFTNAPLGTNSFYAVALSSIGQGWTSAVVTVSVLNIGVTITSPLDGTTYLSTNSITVAAVASVPSGAITNVEFFADGLKFGQDALAPFSSQWTGVSGGIHRLTAVGKHNSGISYTSSPVVVSFPRAIVPTGSVWKFLDNGSDPGTSWTAPNFDDATWSAGPAELGYGDGDEATTVGYGPDPNNRYITTYFRHAFNVTGAANYTNLLVRVRRDDGAVAYLNGTEVGRFNMPAGVITNGTLATLASDDGASFYGASAAGSLLVEGRNVLAVEIHQNHPTSDDITFDLQLEGVLKAKNLLPLITLVRPAEGAAFLAPPGITIEADANDPDGRIVSVQFVIDGVVLAEGASTPYLMTWNDPPPGWHTLRVVARDDLDGTASAEATVNVYDASGSPLVQITDPPNGTVVEGPTNMLVSAKATAPAGITNVQFYANGALIGEDTSSPYGVPWNAPFGSNALTAIAFDANGQTGTSVVAGVIITIPPTNTVAPVIAGVNPGSGATITALTSVRVTFSENVSGVDAGDLLLNGVPATQVSGSGSNYTFTVTQPPYGFVNVTWASGHGIADFGYPSSLPFDETAPDASWVYNLVDRIAPTVIAKTPPANTVVTNLSQVTVTFSELVNGVDASDFLVNGVPAFNVTPSGTTYTFNFSQPASGTVNITWSPAHGIADQAASPNPFNATGGGATWNYTLDTRTILVQSNATWRFLKGFGEASTPIDEWRQQGYDDAGWSNALAPFFFGDPYNGAANPGTALTDMQGSYSSIYLRHAFNLPNASLATNLFLNAQIDDGFIAWINGIEVARFNMPSGEVPYNGLASATANEPNNNGAGYIVFALPNPSAYLVNGVNVLAIHAFNQSLAGSSDFGFNGQLYTFLVDPTVIAPRIASVDPSAGTVFYLTNITVRFSEPVNDVEAEDLLINNVPATSVSTADNTSFTFRFPQPAFGTVVVSWVSGHNITDTDSPPKPFDSTAPGSSFVYTYLNPSTPTIASQSPLAGTTIGSLTQLNVAFSEPVTGVDAADLRINGVPATGVSGSGANYVFTFTQPPYGQVAIGWSDQHGIRDLDNPSNLFEATRAGSSWYYTLEDKTPPALAAISPLPGSQVTNLTQVIITFSEAVAGVNASDLLVNGLPATSVSGSSPTFTFEFPQPNANFVNFTWVNNHGIRDLAPVPNAFDSTAPGSTWSYATPDTVAPRVANLEPAPFVTIRSLTQIRVTFTEPVTGVTTNDLLVNNIPVRQVSGSGAGPYSFTFLPPPNGAVAVRWTSNHGIADLGTPPNPFGGGEWSYTLDPNASFAGKVLINELMFNPLGGRPADEWIELRNVSGEFVNLTGWRFVRGVDFVFPNISIAPNGYFVVAADLEAFQATHAGVTNVVGGWTGRLANSEETVELETALGETVNSVHYATEGDWARRERGGGAEIVSSITRSGSTATVTIFNHGYTANDEVIISGAEQPEYNGRFTVGGVSPTTFTITVSGTPASPATGDIVSRLITDNGVSGWSWFAAADGFGNSLELVNPNLPNTAGQNWLPSVNAQGTPGQANSVASSDVAPLLLDVTHFPPVPHSTDSITISARARDELSTGVQSVTLFYREHSNSSPGPFINRPMFDDGTHNDGVAGDGLFGAVLTPFTNRTVVEFYVEAADKTGHTRTWPAPAREFNGTLGQLANALFQVDDEVVTNLMPAIRVIMTGTERAIFPPSNRNGDAEMNVTMVATDGDGTKIRYLGGVRVRGAGSRTRTPPNNRLNIPNDNPWNGMHAMNLNGQFIHAQIMGGAVAKKAGVAASDTYLIQYRINGVNPTPINAPVNGSGNGAGYGTFLLVEPVNGDLAANLFPEDGDGNVYRASSGNHSADLGYYGTNAANYLGRGYFKTSNQTENDWTDLVNLCFALNQVVSDQDYTQAVSTNVNVEAWMRYFALGTLINYGETSMFNGRGDDYALYRGLKDPRFVPIGHDFDTVFGQGDTTDNPPGTGYYPIRTNASIFIMLNPPNTGGGGFGGNPPNMPALRRLFTNDAFAPLFYAELKQLADTILHPSQINPLMDQLLTGWGNGPTTLTIDAMKNYAAGRRAAVLAQIPLTLTVSNSLTVSSGFPFSTSPNVVLYGTSHAIDTRKVLVNGVPATWAGWDARWTNTVTLQPGVNQVLVQSLNADDREFARATLDIWYDDGSLQSVSGAISSDTIWTAAGGPYNVTGTVTVSSGATLTIQPGTTIYLASGANLIVANGGRLLAEGTDTARIRLTRLPGSSANWGGITINGGPSSPETRITYTHLDGNGSTAIACEDATAFLDHLTFGNTTRRYIDVDRSSFVISHCVFPTATAQFELVHGTGGVKAGGHAIFLRNFFGKPNGYNDTVDFTGGNRPGPIVQFINNVFMGSDDDILDLDSTDAWVERNVFLHTHRNGSPDSSSAISGGADNADTSQITVVGNLFYDVDQAANAKQGNFYTMINNTIVHQSRIGSQDTTTAVVILADDGTEQAAGMYLEGNIIYDAENLTRNLTTAAVTFTNNIIYQLQGAPWTGPGGGNVNTDPLLTRIPPFTETTNFTSWEAAQVMWEYFAPQVGSPAIGTGPNGRNKGGVVPIGVFISGEPDGITPRNSATLRVDPLRTGNGIPAAGFPNGSGYTHYKWRLDGGAWSAETVASAPINLSGLANGQHYVEVIGKLDSGFYQDDPVYGADAGITVSRTWTVSTSASPLRLSEILAANLAAFVHQGTTPDAIEIQNTSSSPANLAGVRLTDEIDNPDKFIFPAGATLAAGAYLVVFANNPDGTPGYHIGFNLDQEGDAIYLFDAPSRGGALIDSVSFGPQITDLSVGRLPYDGWALNTPTLGLANRAARLGSQTSLRINEWLALEEAPFDNDFIELYNPDPLPVALGDLYLSDEVVGQRDRHQIAALSFIAGFGYQRFVADSDAAQGPQHLDFRLNAVHGQIALYLPDLTGIDCIEYQPQRLNISQGRSPNGASTLAFFNQPTPGAPNPLITGPGPTGGALVVNEVLALNAGLVEGGRTPDWVELYNGTSSAIDLTDRSLSDDTLQPRRYVFPAGTTLAPGARLRVLCDPNNPNAVPLLNTNFALKSSGGAVYLFDAQASGGSLLDAIVYGIQIADFSIGRVPDGGTNWVLTTPTPNAANAAVPALGNINNLKVNEWLADPAPGKDDWLEIYNPNPLPVAIGELHLTDDLNARTKHKIAALSFIGAGTNAWQQFVADGNTGAGADHVNFSLRAAGEAIGISSTTGTLIDGLTFGQQVATVSQGRFPDGSPNVISFPGTASPGAANWRWLTNIVINEVLTHTDEPLEDAIELQNLTDQTVDIGGWWLSDDNGTLQKYQIPGPMPVPPHGFAVIYENQFTNRELAAIPFALSSRGDEVVLSASSANALTGYRTSVDFGASANGVSFGRYITSDAREEFVAMGARTFGVDDPGNLEGFREGRGLTNTYPRVGPIVISEIMYHPPDVGAEDNVRDEFIELRNVTTAPVQLFDVANPANVWHLRDGVDFDFPPGTVIEPGAVLLVVSFDPVNNTAALDAFKNAYGIAPGQAIVGPYIGKLANDTDDIELRRPDTPNADVVPYILVDRIRYIDAAPWDVGADGVGLSLTRVTDLGFGNDPTNWVAMAPTPGLQAAIVDFDLDGIPDDWENANGLDPRNRDDAGFDPDDDHLTNLQEYLAGTNPRDGASVLKIDAITFNGGHATLTFKAAANVSYSVVWKESLDAGVWTKLADVAPGAARVETVADPLPSAPTRVYRLVTPQPAGPVNPQPAILSSPRAAAADFGGSATFSVMAAGNGPLTYQWFAEGNPISGATDSTLNVSNIDYNNGGDYTVSVSDGANSATTQPVYLGVRPRIVTHPQTQSVNLGGSFVLNVAAEGIGSLKYFWLLNNHIIPNETNSTLNVDNIQSTNRLVYSVVVEHVLSGRRYAAASSNAVISVVDNRIDIDYVIYMTLDGLGAKYLEVYVTNAPGQFPNFARLMNEGAYTFNARCDYDISETVPNHASMFTARPVLQPTGLPATTHHGYNNNFPGGADTIHANGNPAVPYKASFFDVAHDYGLRTAFYASKTRLAVCDRSYDAVYGALDQTAPDNGRDKIDFSSVVDLSGNNISNEVNGLVADLGTSSPKNFTFIHLSEPDLTGHASNWGSAAWSNTVRMVDGQLGRVFNAINGNPVLSNRTAWIITADHGGGGVVRNGHTEAYHITNYTIPFFLWGPGVPAGANLYTLFGNRADPGTNRLDYTVAPQPIRDGDGGNLGLALLGLPAIPGSFMLPELTLTPRPFRITTMFAADANSSYEDGGRTDLLARRSPLELISVDWTTADDVTLTFTIPAYQAAIIEFNPDMAETEWEPVAEYSSEARDRVIDLRLPAPADHGFFRLRAP